MQWLYLLTQLRLGACLADDMGLGKTIQVLSLLLVLKHEARARRKPCLLVAPASLLANWAAEIARFAPSLEAIVAHPSAAPAENLKTDGADNLADVDLVITSYGYLARATMAGDAQPGEWWCLTRRRPSRIRSAKQTKTVKQLRAEVRIALTGTPIENRLGDLWSIFDFINPGLLGSSKQFSAFVKHLADRPHNPYGPLRDLVRPYILRRLKTDKSIIADLPDKTEVKTFCPLSRKQAALYQQAVQDLANQLEDVDGIKRRGIVLAFLMRLKQICNHPSQWLGDGAWVEEDSGKLARLRDIAEVIAARQEKALIFTQFKEMTAPLQAFLGSVFGRPGLVLHGETRSQDSARTWCGSSRRTTTSRSSCSPSKQGVLGSISPQPRTSSISTGGGTRLWKTRLPTGPSESGRIRMYLCTSSFAAGRRGKDRPDDRVQEAIGWRFSQRRGGHAVDRDEGCGIAQACRSRSKCGDEGGVMDELLRMAALCAGGREAAASRTQACQAQETGTIRCACDDRRPHDCQELLGQIVVRETSNVTATMRIGFRVAVLTFAMAPLST